MLSIYLKIYNVISGFLWLLVPLFYLGVISVSGLNWIYFLAFVQGMAVLDILHIALKWTKSPFLTTLAQYLSRMFVTGIIYLANFVWPLADDVFVQIGTFLILIVWPLAEMIRFAYYSSSKKDAWYRFVRFLRYSAFIVLYHTGVTAEWLLMGKTAFFAYQNNEMAWVYLFVFVFIMYILFFPKLYLYLWNQRKKLNL